ncbi:MAG: GGDEF domain-containing protein [Thermodesulforhabdaceae bacterium]
MELSYIDPMTGIQNLRALKEFASTQIKATIRTGVPTAIIMIDLDDFKKVNDSYGHAVGDIVLKETAKVIKTHIRASDQAFRYGGEEFVVVLPQTQLDEAIKVAERIRVKVESNLICAINGDKPIFSITASLGISIITPESSYSGFEAAFDRADKALMEAKLGGKNMVMWESEAAKKAEVSGDERKEILEFFSLNHTNAKSKNSDI